MGTLIAMAYPTALFAKQADHTYVICGTGKKAWRCWGGKSGGNALRRGSGSTTRADKIAQPDEKAGIKCYLINGVCHQAANRVLLPAGILVRGARGYSISEALFGTYGRVGSWPCKSPFNQYPGETGDLPECAEVPSRQVRSQVAQRSVRTAVDKLDWQYINGVMQIYAEAQTLMKARTVAPAAAQNFHLRLFMYMAEFNLGPMLDKNLENNLKQVRSKIEKVRVKAESAFARKEMKAHEFVDVFNKATIDFQDEMASIMQPAQYETLLDLKPGDHVILADQTILSEAYNLK